jgi:hypothetical protein
VELHSRPAFIAKKSVMIYRCSGYNSHQQSP